MKSPPDNFSPVADVLLIERRTCTRCGLTREAASPTRHRLYTHNHSKRFIIADLDYTFIPLDLRTTYTIEVAVENCQRCWNENVPFDRALVLDPLLVSLPLEFPSPRRAKPAPAEAAKPSILPPTLDELAAP